MHPAGNIYQLPEFFFVEYLNQLLRPLAAGDRAEQEERKEKGIFIHLGIVVSIRLMECATWFKINAVLIVICKINKSGGNFCYPWVVAGILNFGCGLIKNGGFL